MAEESITEIVDIPTWASAVPGEGNSPALQHEDIDEAIRSPFVFDETINAKISLWTGDYTNLQVDGLANPTNESLDKKTPLSTRLHSRAGPALADECSTAITNGGCKTGEVKVTGGHKLPARWVVHTVGPKYNVRYRTAAESALFNCYRGVLYTTKEKEMTTIAIPVINSIPRGYPAEEASHIACRATRRYLEKHGETIDRVVFCVEDVDLSYYKEQLCMYFPRSRAEEAWGRSNLPGDIGNEDGEPVIEERKIRIMTKPVIEGQEKEDGDESSDDDAAARWNEAGGFASMSGDHDQQRQQALKQKAPESSVNVTMRKYQRWLQKARQSDLSKVTACNILRTDGVDSMGRRILSFVGRNYTNSIDADMALCYFISTMDPVVNKDYVIVYYHTLVTSENQPSMSLMKQLYQITDQRYKENLKAIYVIHPTVWSKMFSWLYTTFNLGDVSKKIQNISMLRDLFTRNLFDADQLSVPDFVVDHDKRIHKSTYSMQPNHPQVTSDDL